MDQFFFLSLALISSSVLIYQQRTTRTQLQKLESQAQQQYLLQEIDLLSISTTDLTNNPRIHAFFTDLLRNFAEIFARNKNIDLSLSPLKFAGFHDEPMTGNNYGEMGRCWKEPKTAKISLNRLYLLNKFGHDKTLLVIPN